MQTFQELFLHTLRDIYHGEKQLLRALPKMAKKAETPELKDALTAHRDETLGQVERLERVFELLDTRARGEPCHAIEGLIEEGKEVMEEVGDAEVRDAGIIAAAQAVEHYEIARYGTLVAWARQLGYEEAIPLLEETLAEEKKTDKLLTQLAYGGINQAAEDEEAEAA